MTPVEKIDDWYVKRDDKYEKFGINGGKLRSAEAFIYKHNKINGIVTAGASISPQTLIVSKIANHLGVDCRVHVPKTSKLGVEVYEAAKLSTVIGHRPGYNSVICARAEMDATKRKYLYVPFGMDCSEAIEQTSIEVGNIPDEVETIIVPVGSAMSIIGILQGLFKISRLDINLIGVITGADPRKRLEKYLPIPITKYLLSQMYQSPYNYHKPLKEMLGDIELDEIYEAKALNFIRKNNLFEETVKLFWIVGKRQHNGYINIPNDSWHEIDKNTYIYESSI